MELTTERLAQITRWTRSAVKGAAKVFADGLEQLRKLAIALLQAGEPEGPEELYTYLVSLGSRIIAGGETGTFSCTVNTPYQIIDVIASAPPATFVLDNFFVGDVNQMLGANSIPADMFFPTAQNRFVRFTPAERGQMITVQARNTRSDAEPKSLDIYLKVRASRRT